MSTPRFTVDASSRLKVWLKRAEVDRAVIYALSARSWQLLAGPVTLVLIARNFSAELQGYYYTFASLLVLQTLVELAFYIVVINVASHQWAHLALDRNGRIVGDGDSLSRLVSLGRLIFKWYAVVSLIFIVGVGAGGYFFFSRGPLITLHWQAPWFALVVLTGFVLWALPFNSLLEGCNQVATIQRFRLNQVILETTVLWIVIAMGGGLWALVASAAVKLMRDLYLLLVQYRRFFEPFCNRPTGARVIWKTDLWPMQWRLALSGFVAYFVSSFFNPIMFRNHGPVVAGQMGMTLILIYAIQTIPLAWIQTKVPRFGVMIAHKDYGALDRFWLRASSVSLVVASLAAAGLWSGVYVMNALTFHLASRLLPPLPTGVLLVAMVLMQIGQCQTAYLRAHRQEPIMVLSVTLGVASGLVIWLCGRRYGPTGAALGYLIVVAGSLVWETIVWFRCRAKWQAPQPESETLGRWDSLIESVP